jgi:hypothetical protein
MPFQLILNYLSSVSNEAGVSKSLALWGRSFDAIPPSATFLIIKVSCFLEEVRNEKWPIYTVKPPIDRSITSFSLERHLLDQLEHSLSLRKLIRKKLLRS